MRRGRVRGTRLVLLGAWLTVAAATPAAAQEPLPPNPFTAFQTVLLPNGMRVWYAYLPGSELTRLAVVVPAGRDAEDPAAGQVAHLLEHVLLGDRAGRTEADLVRELALRGGSHGGYTTPSTTVFPLAIPTTQAEYGVRWLYDVVAPRLFGDDQADRNRQPVAVEIGARPPTAGAMLAHRFLRDPRLLPAPFWQREFRLDVPEERFASDAGLWRIGGADLRAFHERWYAPPAMTLVVVTGLPLPVLFPGILETFGNMPWRPPSDARDRATVRRGHTRHFAWDPGAVSTSVVLRYRFTQPSRVEHMRLVFLEDMLRHRLMERLRRGDDKLVYAVAASTVLRGGAGFLAITADVAPGREREVRSSIESELRRLAAAAADSTAFYTDRDILARRVRLEGGAPGVLLAWAADRFAPALPQGDMPDLGGYYTTVGPDSIGELAARLFHDDNLALYISRPLPVPLALAVLAGLAPALLGVRLFRRWTLRPADMARIRYVARLRPQAGAAVLLAAAGLLGGVVAARLMGAGIHIGHARWIAPVDSLLLHAAVAAAVILAATLLLFTAVGAVPRKVLVFDDEVRLKSATFRSTSLPAASIAAVRIGRPSAGISRRLPWLPVSGTGVTLALEDGSAVFLPVRDAAALAAAVAPLVDARLPRTPLAPVSAGPAQENAWEGHAQSSHG